MGDIFSHSGEILGGFLFLPGGGGGEEGSQCRLCGREEPAEEKWTRRQEADWVMELEERD